MNISDIALKTKKQLDAQALVKSVLAQVSTRAGDSIQSLNHALASGRNTFIPLIDTAALTIPDFMVRELKSWDMVSQYSLEILKRLSSLLQSSMESEDFRFASSSPLLSCLDVLGRFVPGARIRRMLKNERTLASFIALDEAFRHELVDHRTLFMRSSYGAFLMFENCVSHFLFLEGWEKRKGDQRDDWERAKRLISFRRQNYEQVIDGCGYALECSAGFHQIGHLASLLSSFCGTPMERIRKLIEANLGAEVESMYFEAKRKRDFYLWNQAIQWETALAYAKRFFSIFGDLGPRVAAFVALNPTIEHPLQSTEALIQQLKSNHQPYLLRFELESAWDRLQKISEIAVQNVPKRIKDEPSELSRFICSYLGWKDAGLAYSETLINLKHLDDGFWFLKAGELFPDFFPGGVRTPLGLEKWYGQTYYPSFIIWQVDQFDKNEHGKRETYMTAYGKAALSGKISTKLLGQAFQESRIDLLPKSAFVNNPAGPIINFILTEFERQICEGKPRLSCPFSGFISCGQCKTDFFDRNVRPYEEMLDVILRCES